MKKDVTIETEKKSHESKQVDAIKFDAMNYLLDLNPKSKERKALQYLVDNRNRKNNIVIVMLSKYDKKNFFYEGAKKLVEDNIIKKIRNGIYIVSPFFIVSNEISTEAKEEWEKN